MSDAQLRELLSALTPPAPRPGLTPPERKGALPGTRAVASYTPPAQTSGTGIASPLTEQAAGREYHEAVLIPSVDGLAWIKWRSVKKITLRDANNAAVVMEFANVTP